jgi:hypothetical protein
VIQALGTRTLFAVALVLLTWNPSGYSYVDWALRDREAFDAVKAFAGILLLGGWVFCVRAAWVSLGALGLALVAALLGTIVWMLVQFGVVKASDQRLLVWIVLVAAGIVLGVGLSWAKMRQRVSGEIETNPDDH